MSKLLVCVFVLYVVAIWRLTCGASLERRKRSAEEEKAEPVSWWSRNSGERNSSNGEGTGFFNKPVNEMTDEEFLLYQLLNPTQYVLMDQRDLIIRKPDEDLVKDYANKAIKKFNAWSPGSEVRLVRVINATGEKTGQLRERLELEVQNIRTQKTDCIFVVVFSVSRKYLDFYFEMCKYPWENAKLDLS
ncbi:unnamed protein product [Bursaphelenchus xylophilus]|uniref:(pine wood nematode) hypothetical protein n=1 Tax=Bursaphelenchus xylophilus TaxID=6326 RepID=A0A1I7SL71_BURXY|nr:unnamed protein product [Bursaphelenchus xylophilus]CAG9129390.1 unnamed protein product [Bursaphelenchus xylophilus]